MNSLPLQFHPEARTDAIEAFEWYSDRNGEVAIEFRKALEEAGRSIQGSPQRWPPYLMGTRRFILKRFPFVIVYRIANDRIEIIAVAHGKRKPDYWQSRVVVD